MSGADQVLELVEDHEVSLGVLQIVQKPVPIGIETWLETRLGGHLAGEGPSLDLVLSLIDVEVEARVGLKEAGEEFGLSDTSATVETDESGLGPVQDAVEFAQLVLPSYEHMDDKHIL